MKYSLLLQKSTIQRYLFSLVLLVIFQTSSIGQYFQQQVDFDISATLMEESHSIQAKSIIRYTNNSSQALPSILFHLWANAYSEKTTAFGEQQLASGKRTFYFAKESEMGGYKEISFKSNGVVLNMANLNDQVDVVSVHLNEVLEPGESVEIVCDFTLRIPKTFSRMGRVDRGYNITQWYPKPAVFDQDGWHPMPYLDQGEFYSEFGNYKVELNLPSSYVVAGTGELQDESEDAILRKMAKDKTAYPDREGHKTLEYRAEKVHDFAFFVHKDFRIRHDQVEINDRVVDCWAFFREGSSDTWEKGAEYVSRAVAFYSSEVGDYPFPQATAVEGETTGGGMEYPMITIIGDTESAMTLDEIIAHEVGHNWFYGILASNERKHPWIDEGFNSYIELKYMDEYYGDSTRVKIPEFLGMKDLHWEKEALRFQVVRGFDQPGGNSSENFKGVNYGLMAYYKPAFALQFLEGYVGEDQMRNAMRDVFDQGKFTHVSPKNVQSIMESSLNKDLSWLFDDILTTTKIVDYEIDEVKKKKDGQTKIEVYNHGSVESPFSLRLYKNDRLIEEKWVEGFSGEKDIKINNTDADRIVLGEEKGSMDFGVNNNHYRIGALSPKLKKLKLRRLPFFHDGSTTDVLVMPSIGWNLYDGFQLGIHAGNMGVIPKRFVWNVTPKFAFKSQEIVGTADVHYNFIRSEGKVRNIQLGAKVKRYSFAENEKADYALDYNRYQAGLRFFLRGSENKIDNQEIYIRASFYDVERARHTSDSVATTTRDFGSQYNTGYVFKNSGILNPYTFSFDVEYKPYTIGIGNFESDEHYVRLGLTHNQSFYYRPKRKIDLRVFAGYFISNSRRDAGSVLSQLAENSLGLSYQGVHDDFYQNFGGRSEQEGFWSHQVAMQEGGFKNAFTSAYANVIANSNSLVMAINFKADNPIEIPVIDWIKPYFDLGYFDDKQPSRGYSFSDQLLWSGGVMIEIGDGLLAFYLPLINSQNINDVYDQLGYDNVWKRFSFSIDLLKINPYELAETFEFQL